MSDLFDALDALDDADYTRVRTPFQYPGSKSRSVDKILPHLPMKRGYVEPFGGSFSVGLSRKPCTLEVYNDTHSGIVSFYRVMRDPRKWQILSDYIKQTVHAREEFEFCKESWQNENLSDIDRAFRWYYLVRYSFGGLQRNFGRATSPMTNNSMSGKLRNMDFFDLHQRLAKVMIEHRDYRQIIQDFDHPETVFYMDPPYVDVFRGTYKNEMTIEEHRELCAMIMNMESFVAISGYDNDIYNSFDWDDKVTWEVVITIEADKFVQMKGHKSTREECLWIKYER